MDFWQAAGIATVFGGIAWRLLRWVARTSRELDHAARGVSTAGQERVSDAMAGELIRRGLVSPATARGMSAHEAAALLRIVNEHQHGLPASPNAVPSGGPAWLATEPEMVTAEPGLTIIRQRRIAGAPGLACPACGHPLELAGATLPANLVCAGCRKPMVIREA